MGLIEKGKTMSLDIPRRHMKWWVLSGSILLLPACVDYTIETTLHDDGGGYRSETMEVTENDDLEMSPESFGAVMSVTGEDGWKRSIEIDSKGDTTNIFERGTRVLDLGAWSKLTDAVQIAGALPDEADTRVGYLSLGDIRFRNRVEVEKGTLTDGSARFTYRETFYWENAAEAFVEVFMSSFSQALAEKYPSLTPTQKGEIVGIARAHLWAASYDGLFDINDDTDRLLDQARERTTKQGIGIIRMQYPQESGFFLRDLLQKLYDGSGEAGERANAFFEGHLPGLNLAFNTSLKIRLNMPGQVMNSNNDEVDGSTLVWEFGPLSAAAAPMEIFAESVVGG
jgi:hypothetical protein